MSVNTWSSALQSSQNAQRMMLYQQVLRNNNAGRDSSHRDSTTTAAPVDWPSPSAGQVAFPMLVVLLLFAGYLLHGIVLNMVRPSGRP